MPHQVNFQPGCIRGEEQPLFAPLSVFEPEQRADFDAPLFVIRAQGQALAEAQ
ncbi:hypothetical protein D3C76_1688920 [compost metagenome]